MTFKVYGEHDENTLRQMGDCMVESAVAGVLCADGHFGYRHPIGGVVGYSDHISVSGVGFDIGCGNKAVRLDVQYDWIRKNRETILKQIQRTISFGVGRANEETVDDPLFESELWDQCEMSYFKDRARSQLGTVGGGNHYVDLFSDQEGWVWIGVHFGSRGLGHQTTTKFLRYANAPDTMEGAPVLFKADSDLGRAYYAGVQLGGLYAYAGRDWVTGKVADIIGGAVQESVHNHHNYCWEEEHNGQRLYVVRKGATPAFPDQLGFVGGSMGEKAVILRGLEGEESASALYSTVHGAGRVMSRTAAKGKVHRKTGRVIAEPRVDREEWNRWMRERDIYLLGGDLDEAPQAYRRLHHVLEAHAGTVAIDRVLTPWGVIMAGEGVKDPYKD